MLFVLSDIRRFAAVGFAFTNQAAAFRKSLPFSFRRRVQDEEAAFAAYSSACAGRLVI
jgi:hypothetical protein